MYEVAKPMISHNICFPPPYGISPALLTPMQILNIINNVHQNKALIGFVEAHGKVKPQDAEQVRPGIFMLRSNN